MIEKTYVRSHDHCEVYVIDEDGVPTEVYGYRDSLPDIPGVVWLHGLNTTFRYASDPQVAADYVQEHFNHPTDED